MDFESIKSQIRVSLLEHYGLSARSKANDIFKVFWKVNSFYTVLSVPEVLDSLIDYIKQDPEREVIRYDFFEYFDSTKSLGESELLSAIALYLEINNITEIKLDSIRQIASGLNLIVNNEMLSEYVRNGVLTSQSNIAEKTYSFKHNLILEFYVARYIAKAKNPVSILNELALINDKVIAIKPNWYNEITLLIETNLSQDLCDWLINLGRKTEDIIDEGFTIAITSANRDVISEKTSNDIFQLVYKTYQNRKIWFPLWSRQELGLFASYQQIKNLKNDAETAIPNDYITKGNVVEVIDSLLEARSKNIDSKDREYWKNQFISFANDQNENGVLQRNALSALANYKDSKIIDKVSVTFKSPDSLIRQGFIRLCCDIDPNSVRTIQYLSKATKKDLLIDVYYGIEKISTKQGILNLLSEFANDSDFLRLYLDKEGYTSKKDKSNIFIKKIKRFRDARIVETLEKILYTSFIDDKIFQAEKSEFISSIAKIIINQNKNYIKYVIDRFNGESNDKNIFSMIELFGLIVNDDNYDLFINSLSSDKFDQFTKARLVSLSLIEVRRRNKSLGNRLYSRALESGVAEKIEVKKSVNKRHSESNIKKKFLHLLEPSVGTFDKSVFRYFIDNIDVLKPLNEKSINRLKKLTISEALRHDPKSFTFRLTNPESNSFSWSSINDYYGYALKCAIELFEKEELSKYRENIINYLPFAFNEELTDIYSIVESISDEDLSYVNETYASSKDLKYFSPTTYAYFIEHYLKNGDDLKTPKAILKLLIEDPKIDQDYIKEALIKTLDVYLTKYPSKEDEEYLLKLASGFESPSIKDLLNSILIRLYSNTEAINWRFDQIKARIQPFKEESTRGFHTVSPLEDELYRKDFAKPLLSLESKLYIDKFIQLLDFTLTVIDDADEKQYWPYIQYIWNVVIDFVDKQASKNDANPLSAFKEWIDLHSELPRVNWLNGNYEKLKRSFVLADKSNGSISNFISILERIDGNR